MLIYLVLDTAIRALWLLLLLFSCSVTSNSLGPHGLRHAKLSCPSLSPGVCSNSCSLSQWCYLTISSSATPFSLCLQSFPASGSFPMSCLKLRIRWPKYWTFSFSISPSDEYSGLISFRIDWSPCSPRDSQVSSPVPQLQSLTQVILVITLQR